MWILVILTIWASGSIQVKDVGRFESQSLCQTAKNALLASKPSNDESMAVETIDCFPGPKRTKEAR